MVYRVLVSGELERQVLYTWKLCGDVSTDSIPNWALDKMLFYFHTVEPCDASIPNVGEILEDRSYLVL